MSTYPLPTLGPTISATGISIPSYSDVYLSLIAKFQEIYGSDIYVSADSQDGQWLAAMAKAIDDSNQAAVSIFMSFSPTYAQGNQLSSVVKINGIARNTSGYSTADGYVVGEVGRTISNGVVQDSVGNLWNLPVSVTIPPAGQILVTIIAQQPGAIGASAGTINKIYNPQLGWQEFYSTTDASVGAPVETDAELRLRQTQSTALGSLTVLDGIAGAIANLTGVTQVKAYENDTGLTDSDGLPPHSISMVVEGGDATAIATAIMNKKTPGAYTYGSTVVPVTDNLGLTHDIRFFVPTQEEITVEITLRAFAGYSSTTADAIKTAVADYINALLIGQDVLITKLYVPAQLNSIAASSTFELITLLAAVVGDTPTTSDVLIPFNGVAKCSISDINITVI
jgi:uncharacterized phage protein gp47/JayE